MGLKLMRTEYDYWVEYKVKMNRKILHKGKCKFQENLGCIVNRDIHDAVTKAIYANPDFDVPNRDMFYLKYNIGANDILNRADISFFENGVEEASYFTLQDGIDKKIRFICTFKGKKKAIKVPF